MWRDFFDFMWKVGWGLGLEGVGGIFFLDFDGVRFCRVGWKS